MNIVELRETTRHRTLPRRFPLCTIALLWLAGPLVAAAAEPAAASTDEAADDAIVSLAAYNVKADRIEDFGLRIDSAPYPDASRLLTNTSFFFATFAPLITSVVPNTAAAKAGLQPGERILKSDGRTTIGGLFSTGKFGEWSKSQKKKWAEVSAGKINIAWTLEVESPLTKTVRTVKLVIPTPPPHWGAAIWRAPEGRKPSTVAETGPLAERSRMVLDHGIPILLHWPLTTVLDESAAPRSRPLVTGYEWRLENGRNLHRMVVTQLRGGTQIFFETSSGSTAPRQYLTSPSGVLEKAWGWSREANIAMMRAKTRDEVAQIGRVPLEEARIGFEHELDLWTTKVRKVSPRWPMEVIPGYDPDAIFAALAPKGAKPAAAPTPHLAEEFLKLPVASADQRTLFTDAYGKLGADSDQWAYTETSHGLDDQRVLVTRVDPSKPETERSVLLSIDGKTPTAVDVQRWRDDGGDTPKALGELPPLSDVVDFKDVRVFQDDPATTIFELPIRGGRAEFPAEKLSAHFRVNKTSRALEDITVKLRDSFRVAGVVKVTDAGLEIQFAALDPKFAPQPAHLKAGGGVRVLLVKISRAFEVTRTDFKRVVPFDEAAVPAK